MHRSVCQSSDFSSGDEAWGEEEDDEVEMRGDRKVMDETDEEEENDNIKWSYIILILGSFN